jgi:hypothetical protein
VRQDLAPLTRQSEYCWGSRQSGCLCLVGLGNAGLVCENQIRKDQGAVLDCLVCI